MRNRNFPGPVWTPKTSLTRLLATARWGHFLIGGTFCFPRRGLPGRTAHLELAAMTRYDYRSPQACNCTFRTPVLFSSTLFVQLFFAEISTIPDTFVSGMPPAV